MRLLLEGRTDDGGFEDEVSFFLLGAPLVEEEGALEDDFLVDPTAPAAAEAAGLEAEGFLAKKENKFF